MTRTEFAIANQRRAELIFKRRDEGLSIAEEVELNRLQHEVVEHIDAKYPLPFDALRRMEQKAAEILQKENPGAVPTE